MDCLICGPHKMLSTGMLFCLGIYLYTGVPYTIDTVRSHSYGIQDSIGQSC
jgi:hypothetical protein